MLINLPAFIAQHVTGRSESLFLTDFERFRSEIRAEIQGKSVLVIGGAGSIGSAFIQALLPFEPARIFVVDTNENALTELVRDLRSSLLPIPPILCTYPLDFGDAVFEKILHQEGPFEVVANFAAHKHVRSEKDGFAISAMLANNVFKTKHLLDLLSKHPPAHFFCVSTDKAAEPVNVMGASKKLMERLVLAYSDLFPVKTARFANVAFSNGSLLDGFLARIAKRQPLSAPLDIERYFVSPEEAGQLCLLACVLGQSGDVFFPKLDLVRDVRRFSDIGVQLLQVFGYQADICGSEQEAREKAAHVSADSDAWPVYFFHSNTTGEKGCEVFYSDEETLDLNRFEQLGVIQKPGIAHNLSPLACSVLLQELQAVLAETPLQKAAIIRVLQQLVPDFQHVETGNNLDASM